MRTKRRFRTGLAAALAMVAVAAGDVEGIAQTAPAQRSAPPANECRKDPAMISCEADESVRTDLAQLQALTRQQFRPFAGEGFGADDVKIQFVGKARTVDQESINVEALPESLQPTRRPEAPAPMDAWRLFNPATQNEFQLTAPPAIRAAFDDLLRDRGDAKPAVEASPDSREFRALDWSGGDDSRVEWTGSLNSIWGSIANIGGCTGTFVGPRHVVTAGHCIYNRSSAAWTTNFSVQPRRSGANIPLTTSMPPGPGQTGWYFTPVGWRTASTDEAQFDFAVIVVADRLGDTTSWMNYGALSTQDMLNGKRHVVRGYPLCESETGPPGSVPERIDEPAPTCTTNGFYYGDPCSVQSFSSKDPSGWSRRVTHGCDASAGNSGSALYTWFNGTAMVVGIHTTSTTCRNPGDPPCTAADTHPLVATRITPEYRGWISYFRAEFP